MSKDFNDYDINLVSFYNNNKFNNNKFFITYNFTNQNFSLENVNFKNNEFFLEKINNMFFILKLSNLNLDITKNLIIFYDKIYEKVRNDYNLRNKIFSNIESKSFLSQYCKFNLYIINKEILKIGDNNYDISHNEFINILKSDIDLNFVFTAKYFIIKNNSLIVHFYIKHIIVKESDENKLPPRVSLIVKYGKNSNMYKITEDLNSIYSSGLNINKYETKNQIIENIFNNLNNNS